LALQITSSRKLPEDRKRPTTLEYGYKEPKTIQPGRCSMRQALTFLSEHRTDPDEVGSAESIARRYNLDVKRVDNVLTHFGVFDVETPKALSEGAKQITETEFSVKVPDDMVNDTYRKS